MHGYAEIKGYQYRLEPGAKLKVPFLGLEEGKVFEIFPLLMLNDGEKNLFGAECKGFSARATVLKNGRAPKVTIFKKSRKKGYQLTRKHRQDFTAIRIEEIIKPEEK